MTLTPTTRRALTLIKQHQPITPGWFAPRMWPDSPHVNESYKCGPYGSAQGRGLVKAAGGYLGTLRKRGLVYRERREFYHPKHGLRSYDGGYCLTVKGEEALLNWAKEDAGHGD